MFFVAPGKSSGFCAIRIKSFDKQLVCIILCSRQSQKGDGMNGYIGCSKKDIEDLIESVNAPGVTVKRANTAKKQSGVVYRFMKNGKNMFALCSVQDCAQLAIMRGTNISDLLCAGDDGYRKACVLYQLAEKMYEMQSFDPKQNLIAKVSARVK